MNKLDRMLNPSTIAIVGVSRKQDSVGHTILKNLLSGGVLSSPYCKPFKGRVFPVNPYAATVAGVRCYPTVNAINEDIDLAIIAVPAKIVPSVMEDCAKKNVSGVIIVSAGFAETGKEGAELQHNILRIAHNARIPLIGPNCLGVIRPSISMNASFAPTMPRNGSIAFISQSGALADSVIDSSIKDRLGFSTIISYGNGAGLKPEDFIEWLAGNRETKVITVYIEGLEDGRRFMKVAMKASKKKPVVVLKAGKTDEGARAISSHTGSLAGSYQVYQAAFKQSNLIVADSVEELFDIAKALASQPACKKNSIAIVTNGGGCGVLCADYCTEFSVKLAQLKQNTLKKIKKTGLMHPAYSGRNPLDIVGDASPERYHAAIDTLLKQPDIYGLIVIQTMQTMTDSVGNAKAVVELHKKHSSKPIVCAWLGGTCTQPGSDMLEQNSIPVYDEIKKAATAMSALIRRGFS